MGSGDLHSHDLKVGLQLFSALIILTYFAFILPILFLKLSKEDGGKFFYDNKYIHFSDYADSILSSSEMAPFVNMYPASVNIHLNEDL